jgi:hypothetical protein
MRPAITRKVKVLCLTPAEIITIDREHFEQCKLFLLTVFSLLERSNGPYA